MMGNISNFIFLIKDEAITAGIILDKLKFDKKYPLSAVLYWGETPSPFLVNFGTMTRTLKITTFFLLFLLLALLNMAMAPSTQELLSPTNTPEVIKPADTATLVSKVRRATATVTRTATNPSPTRTKVALSLEMQAGHSDGIALIGILIVAIIIIPILLKYQEWRVH